MKRIIHTVLFGSIGGIMSSAGVTIESWQLYAVIFCAASACAASEVLK